MKNINPKPEIRNPKQNDATKNLRKTAKWIFRLFAFIIIFLPFLNLYSEEIYNSTLVQALRDEMQRSIRDLKLENQSPPYYLAYRVVDENRIEIKASYGGLISSNELRSRDLYVDLRVGSKQLDNSNFICQISGSRMIDTDRTQLPVEDDYLALRKAIWLVTDGTYKKAFEKLARKKAYLQNKQDVDTIPDFSSAEPCSLFEYKVASAVDRNEYNDRVVSVSKVFQRYPEIFESTVSLNITQRNVYFIDNEGGFNCKNNNLCGLEIRAKARAHSGEIIEDLTGYYYDDYTKVDFEGIEKLVSAWAETLSMQTRLVNEESYSGPVLFLGQASAEFFFQIVGKGVSDARSLVFESEMLERNIQRNNLGILSGKLGRKVAPSYISVYDDPNLKVWNNIPLIGSFPVDDQGVKSERVQLIKDGKLVGLLMSRAPTGKIAKTNGHAKYFEEPYGPRFVGFVGNLVIETNKKNTIAELMTELKKLAIENGNEYAIVITRLQTASPKSQMERYRRIYGARGKAQPLLASPVVAYKIYTNTGEMQLIKGLDFSQVTPRILRDIVATGDSEYVHNFVYYDDNGNAFPVSVVAPAVLVEEMDLVQKQSDKTKAPIVSRQ